MLIKNEKRLIYCDAAAASFVRHSSDLLDEIQEDTYKKYLKYPYMLCTSLNNNNNNNNNNKMQNSSAVPHHSSPFNSKNTTALTSPKLGYRKMILLPLQIL